MFLYIYSRPLWLVAVIIFTVPLVRGVIRIPKWLNHLLLCFCVFIVLHLTLLRFGSDKHELIIQPFYSFEIAKVHPEYYREMMMNVLLFVPLGLFLPHVFNKHHVIFTIIVAVLLSVTIESLQYIFSLGLSEIDDVICNTTGATIGSLSYSISLLSSKICKNH